MIEDGEIAPLAAALDRRLDETETAYHRPLYFMIYWDKSVGTDPEANFTFTAILP